MYCLEWGATNAAKGSEMSTRAGLQGQVLMADSAVAECLQMCTCCTDQMLASRMPAGAAERPRVRYGPGALEVATVPLGAVTHPHGAAHLLL